jgi:hypothetical protein
LVNIGQNVTWTSQANGSAKTKTGKVLVILKAGRPAYKVMPPSSDQFRMVRFDMENRTLTVLRSHVRFDSYIPLSDRVLVEVPRMGSGAGLHDYYAPSLKVIEKQNPGGQDGR